MKDENAMQLDARVTLMLTNQSLGRPSSDSTLVDFPVDF